MSAKRKGLPKNHLKKTAIELLKSEKYSKVNGLECAEQLKRKATPARKPRMEYKSSLEAKIRDSLKNEAA